MVRLVGTGVPLDLFLMTFRELLMVLFAMATHGRAGLSRVTSGSVTEEVLRKAEVPLLVTRVAKPAGKAKPARGVKAGK